MFKEKLGKIFLDQRILADKICKKPVNLKIFRDRGFLEEKKYVKKLRNVVVFAFF